ncbi:MAG: bifunctional glutamate N-acetyltransferase/amino-acid acetyltransferase ArgJ [Anaerolineae bacterium]
MIAHHIRGFSAAGVSCGLKREAGALDLALIASGQPCTAAGVFTTNRVKAAPVLYDQAVLAAGGMIRAVVVNAGNANACTGAAGMTAAHATAAGVAAALGCSPGEVLVLSTGVIGVPLPVERVLRGITAAAQILSPVGWADAATAIMTTDTRPKAFSITTPAGYTVAGVAKGAGMIAPNMATMLAVIVTDAAVPVPALDAMLRAAVDVSFNRIVVDGDMSTNDTVLALANGASGVAVGAGDAVFQAALTAVCTHLARAIVKDGEGATRFVTLRVTGAAAEGDAAVVARAIATSPLCKTAFYGADPNWGRILCAAGYAGVDLDPDRLALWLLDETGAETIQLVTGGQPANYDEHAATTLMQGSEWGIRLDLGAGAAATTVWTCDLSHEYITINGHYRT